MTYIRDKKSRLIYIGDVLEKESSKHGEKLVVLKGETEKTVDLTELRKRLKRLRMHQSSNVNKLPPQIKEDYEVMKNHVSVLYETKEYKTLYDEVKNTFSDLKVENLKLGTVGAYFAGCLIPLENGDKSCSALCNGSMPRPKSRDGWSFCNYPVVWASFKNGKYEFTVLNSQPGKDCVVYMESPQIYGFDNEEKNHLRSLGYERIQMIHAPLDSNLEYKNINSEFIELNRLPNRLITPARGSIFTPKPTPMRSLANTPVKLNNSDNILRATKQSPSQSQSSSPENSPENSPVRTRAVDTQMKDVSVGSNMWMWIMLLAAVALLVAFAMRK